MRNPGGGGGGNDGVPREIFSGDTARMNREAQERLANACEDAVPMEMVGGETTRIDQTALTGLIEKSEGIAIGTPKRGLPQLEDEAAIEIVEAAPVEVIACEPSRPVLRQSRMRDVLIGGTLSLIVMAAWYCATQL